ncbi:hypothetical protein, partial [Candidatus Hakubella thermalkaliphila]
LLGLIGVWLFAAQDQPVPPFLRVAHAHLSWWSMSLLISSLIMPALSLKRQVKRIITAGAFFTLLLYPLFVVLHYYSVPGKLSLPLVGELFVTPYGLAAFISEIVFFIAMVVLSLLAAGVRFPRLLNNINEPTRYELVSNISVPRKLFGVYAFFLSLSVFIGLYILTFFTLSYKPISPAALVQFHTHVGMFAVGFVMTILAMRAIGAAHSKWQLTYSVGVVALTATVLGFLIFILFNTHSIVWVGPAMLYYGVLVVGWLSLFGKFGLSALGDNYFHFARWALILIWGFLLIFTLTGPYLSLRYNKTPDFTVTYKQLDGGIDGKHVGPYPDPKKDYLGTAPSKNTPRGLENFHLSPGSWRIMADGNC